VNINCPNCGEPHSLFWLIKPGKIRQLSYTCDRAEHQIMTPEGPELRTFSQTHSADHEQFSYKDLDRLPEQWTAAYQKEVQARKQFQLTMTYARPGKD
jgi:hypothetical protein